MNLAHKGNAMDRPIVIRHVSTHDLAQILEIERQCFGPDSWTADEFTRVSRQRDCILLVACEDGYGVVGFVVYRMAKGRYEIVNLAVSLGWQGMGVGRAMLARVYGKLKSTHRNRIGGMVRESNLAAQKFLRACGFTATKVERQPFDGSDEDGYRFVCRIGEFTDGKREGVAC